MAIEVYVYRDHEGAEASAPVGPGNEGGALLAERWTFTLVNRRYSDEVTLRLNGYAKLARLSPRHRWVNGGAHWSRYRPSESIPSEDVPLPEEVRAKAFASVKVSFEPLGEHK